MTWSILFYSVLLILFHITIMSWPVHFCSVIFCSVFFCLRSFSFMFVQFCFSFSILLVFALFCSKVMSWSILLIISHITLMHWLIHFCSILFCLGTVCCSVLFSSILFYSFMFRHGFLFYSICFFLLILLYSHALVYSIVICPVEDVICDSSLVHVLFLK